MASTENVARILADAGPVGLEEGCGEPLRLSDAIAAEGDRRRAHGLPGLDLLCGLVLRPPPWLPGVEEGGITCTTTMPGRGLAGSTHVNEIRLGFPDIALAWTQGSLAVEIACISVTGSGTLGLTWGHAPEMVEAVQRRGGIVLAERNTALPDVRGAPAVDLDGATILDSHRDPVEMRTRPPTDVETDVARNIVSVLPSGACVSIGIGSLGEAVLHQLVAQERRAITFHSGMLGDGHAHIADSPVVGRSTPLGDPPFTATTLLGTSTLFAWAERDDRVRLESTAHVHPPGITSAIDGFCAVNFALEVDLGGNAGAEQVGSRTVSGPGGQLDLATGACAAPRGRSIVALPSTTPQGASRIVPHLSGRTTTPSTRVQFVVTEHGVAEIWGVDGAEKADRLISVAAPVHRPALRAAVYA
ncbi:MAG: hypothetical protein IT198_11620 [Acidimicrobiia bacterium]|nr:hypothetical protein [Acidimicrobiia bacterium]